MRRDRVGKAGLSLLGVRIRLGVLRSAEARRRPHPLLRQKQPLNGIRILFPCFTRQQSAAATVFSFYSRPTPLGRPPVAMATECSDPCKYPHGETGYFPMIGATDKSGKTGSHSSPLHRKRAAVLEGGATRRRDLTPGSHSSPLHRKRAAVLEGGATRRRSRIFDFCRFHQ